MTYTPAWYQWAYTLSEPGLYAACLLAVALLALIAWLVLKLLRIVTHDDATSTLPSGVIGAIALPTSLIIGLLASNIVGKYNDAQRNVMHSAEVVADLRHDLSLLPEAAARKPTDELREYVEHEIPQQWSYLRKSHGTMPNSAALDELDDSLGELQKAAGQPAPTVSSEDIRSLREKVRELDRLETARAMLAVGTMDGRDWAVVLVLMLCCAGALIETTLRHRHYLILVATLFTLSYGSLSYMIVTNDRPFSGHVIVTPEPIEQAYEAPPATPSRVEPP